MLIVERAKAPLIGMWSLPGGRVEAGERVKDAALRELHEETGIVAALDHLVGIYDLIQRGSSGLLQVHFAIACFTGPWTGGVAIAGSDALWSNGLTPIESRTGFSRPASPRRSDGPVNSWQFDANLPREINLPLRIEWPVPRPLLR